MRKIISLFVAVVLMSICVISASAIPAPAYFGDANFDHSRDVTDATFIQRALAELETPSALQKELGDVDGDGNITVFDATMIQMKLAGLIDRYPVGEETYIYMYSGIFTVSEPSAKVGAPVTFTVDVDGTYEPYVYDFYVGDVLVVENSSDNTFTYTFEESGEYRVKAIITNCVENYSDAFIIYEVVE